MKNHIHQNKIIHVENSHNFLKIHANLNSCDKTIIEKELIYTYQYLNDCKYTFGSPILLRIGTTLLRLTSHKKSKTICKLSEELLVNIFDNISDISKLYFISTYILGDDAKNGLSEQAKWKTKVVSLKLIRQMAKSSPSHIAKIMPLLVPVISDLMWDTKKQVEELACIVMNDITSCIDNIDLKPFIPELIDAIKNPENIPDCVYALAGTTFVKTVTAAALSITVPILSRGFKEKQTTINRKCAVVTENLAKLVKDANDVKPFLPLLCPALERGLDTISNPECRERFSKANIILQNIKKNITPFIEISKESICVVLKKINNDFEEGKPLYDYILEMSFYLINYNKDSNVFHSVLANTLKTCNFEVNTTINALTDMISTNITNIKSENDIIESDEDETIVICDLQFSLAYGSNILLNDSRLYIKKGHKYGIIANKSAGKTTLLRAISNGQVEGFPLPSEVKTIFIENDIQGIQLEMSVVEFVQDTVDCKENKITEEKIREMLKYIGFTDEMTNGPITSLSGGWKMKLALGRATLQNADIMLMDEPTNHLDVLNVQWVVDYLNSLPNVTCLIVSHDTAFLDKTVNHIIHFNNLKLDTHSGNVTAFMEIVPQAKAYFTLESSSLKFTFPNPTNLQTGSKQSNKGRTLLQMKNVHFTYPSASSAQLKNVNVKASMASRVAIVGANGAGKSTLIKLLTGELKPSIGEIKKHPNCRFAYVAQHAFHHIEQHLEKSPNKYICWRYENGEDKEEQNKATIEISEEEENIMNTPWVVSWKEPSTGHISREKRIVEKIISRRKVKKSYEYEIKWKNKRMDDNIWFPRETLYKKGFNKMVTAIDTRLAAMESMNQRALTQTNVTTHLAAIGLEEEYANHSRICDLSGGQKVKVVLAACTWACPHLIILDEPTNYLDRDSLSALAGAIKTFQGGIVLITHNKEFADLTTRETWVVANNLCDVKGDPEWEKYASEQHVINEEDIGATDAYGNKIKVNKKPKKIEDMSRKEIKQNKKALKEKLKRYDELESFELIWAEQWNLL
tara:strand:- start:5655 stop:8741 length:3087 start_codon:yes stop_codon:yes gene_type:complete